MEARFEGFLETDERKAALKHTYAPYMHRHVLLLCVQEEGIHGRQSVF